MTELQELQRINEHLESIRIALMFIQTAAIFIAVFTVIPVLRGKR